MARQTNAQIVALSVRIAEHAALAASYRVIAAGMDKGSVARQDQEQMASSVDSDICQLCVEMNQLCRRPYGPSPSAIR